MSSPREAVYDVLLARQRRAHDEEAADRLAAWDAYEAANLNANTAYRPATTRATRMRDTRNTHVRESVIRVAPSAPNDGPTPNPEH